MGESRAAAKALFVLTAAGAIEAVEGRPSLRRRLATGDEAWACRGMSGGYGARVRASALPGLRLPTWGWHHWWASGWRRRWSGYRVGTCTRWLARLGVAGPLARWDGACAVGSVPRLARSGAVLREGGCWWPNPRTGEGRARLLCAAEWGARKGQVVPGWLVAVA